MADIRTVEVGGISMEFRVDAALVPSAIRALAGLTPRDKEVDDLSVPSSPCWLGTAVRILRWYRAGIGVKLGQRCVFEPSCSRYAELALRRRGGIRGTWLTMLRLWRCRPGKGGIDLP
jgi:putative component of membrane protein insertase Oxa1/YidC/SpoIIIJ protein YidD